MNKIKVIVLAFVLLTIAACQDKREAVATPTTLITPEFQLSNAPSPIDLQGIDADFFKDIPYDVYPKTTFDIFLPNVNQIAGIFIYIHGGGFTGGDKGSLYNAGNWDRPEETRMLLQANIAVATINYRLLLSNGETEGVLKCLNDCRRALQFIRSKAPNYNIDKDNIVLAGNSAGAGASLWLAVNDDMKDPTNADPVLRQSTRVKGVALRQTQASYDLEDKWVNEVFVDYNYSLANLSPQQKAKILQFYGVSSLAEYQSSAIDLYRDQVDMLDLMTQDDPEIWASNIKTVVAPPVTDGIANHHAFHVREIKEKADAVGVQNVCYYGKNPILYEDPSGEEYVDFIIRKINE